MYGKVTN